MDTSCLQHDGVDGLGRGSPLFLVCSGRGLLPPVVEGVSGRMVGLSRMRAAPPPSRLEASPSTSALLLYGVDGCHPWYLQPQSLGWTPSPLAAHSVMMSRLVFGDRVSSLCSFQMQPEPLGGDASAQAAVEKLREENRLLKQKVAHVSACSVSSGERALVPGRGGPWGAWGSPPPSGHFVDTQGPQKPDRFA